MDESLRSPLLVGDEHDRELGELPWVCRQRPCGAQRQHHAALHVGGPRAVQPVAVTAQGPVRVVADDGVHVTEQQRPARAAAAQAGDQVRCAARRRGGHSLDLGSGREQRGAQRKRFLGALHVARRRGDRDQRLELPFGTSGNFARGSP